MASDGFNPLAWDAEFARFTVVIGSLNTGCCGWQIMADCIIRWFLVAIVLFDFCCMSTGTGTFVDAEIDLRACAFSLSWIAFFRLTVVA